MFKNHLENFINLMNNNKKKLRCDITHSNTSRKIYKIILWISKKFRGSLQQSNLKNMLLITFESRNFFKKEIKE